LIKWFASIVILLAVAFRSAGEQYHLFDLYFSLIGSIGWLTVSLAWKDRALIMLNTVMTLTLLTGILK
jgi:ABC-type siderophore export system fused ATPase/permease subunit